MIRLIGICHSVKFVLIKSKSAKMESDRDEIDLIAGITENTICVD